MTALIILNYNNADDTRTCIESIIRHNTAPVKIIVVDNASGTQQLQQLKNDLNDRFGSDFKYYDETAKAPISLPPVSLLETGANTGYARGNNAGLQLAYTDPDIDYVMILNNDIIFVDDIIPRLVEKHKALADCAVISPVLYKKDMSGYDLNCARRCMPVSALTRQNFMHYLWRMRSKTLADAMPGLFMLNDPGLPRQGVIEIQVPSGACMLIEKGYFREIGSFDPATFLFYEENILYKKTQASGRKNYMSLDEGCIHLGASTMQSLPSSMGIVKAGKESELHYVRRYSGASRAERLLHRVSAAFFMATFRLQKLLKKENR